MFLKKFLTLLYKMKNHIKYLTFAVILILQGCTGSVENHNSEKQLWQVTRMIEILPPQGRDADFLKQKLEAQFNQLQKTLNYEYELSLNLTTQQVTLVNRIAYQAQVNIKLFGKENKKLLFATNIRNESKYLSTGTQNQQEKSLYFARERVLNNLALDINLQVKNYFRTQIKENAL